MATQRKNLYLYLTLACFFGLIAIFTVDGYMGVYDTIRVTTGEREEVIEPEHWLRQDTAWTSGAEGNEKVFFRYEVDNRQFSTYSAEIAVSIWRSQEKVRDVVSQRISIGAFDRGRMEWVLDTAELKPGGGWPEQAYEYTVIIKRGEVARKVILSIRGAPFPIKPPMPVR